MHKPLLPSAAMIVLVAALSLALVGTAVAGPSAAKITKAKVRAIAKAQIAKAAPNLSVKNAETVGGRSVSQIKTVLAGAQDANVVNDIDNIDMVMVSVGYTLAAPSTVHFNGVAELGGDGGLGDEAVCFIENDGGPVGVLFETAFDDVGDNNPATLAVAVTSNSVAAGAHTATLVCNQGSGTGTVTKDDAAIQVTAVPN